ncbi:hypothetical protein [Streptomyces gobiensis]|nr:hypothetical protein [Streptomyces gobiensis]UGY92847.1 hypothetical protein test1122_14800 [Streptomyces gobiensis]
MPGGSLPPLRGGGGVRDLTAPRTFAQWAAEHAEAFRQLMGPQQPQ